MGIIARVVGAIARVVGTIRRFVDVISRVADAILQFNMLCRSCPNNLPLAIAIADAIS